MQLNNNDLTDRSKPSNETASKPGWQLKFLLSVKPGETIEEFKERVIQAARETGMLNHEAN
jgi:hypothetical protein